MVFKKYFICTREKKKSEMEEQSVGGFSDPCTVSGYTESDRLPNTFWITIISAWIRWSVVLIAYNLIYIFTCDTSIHHS